MIRTQIYLTDDEHRGLRGVSSRTGESMSSLIRSAVDEFICNRTLKAEGRLARLRKIKGTWKSENLGDFQKIRQEFNRKFTS